MFFMKFLHIYVQYVYLSVTKTKLSDVTVQYPFGIKATKRKKLKKVFSNTKKCIRKSTTEI